MDENQELIQYLGVWLGWDYSFKFKWVDKQIFPRNGFAGQVNLAIVRWDLLHKKYIKYSTVKN